MSRRLALLVVVSCLMLGRWSQVHARVVDAEALGNFTGHDDVGTPSTIGPGSATYDPATKTYTIAGGGENMWATADHFHYVWKKMSGDVILEATLEFVGTSPATGAPEGHRKACLVIRQTLDADLVYADAATHGDGLSRGRAPSRSDGSSHRGGAAVAPA